MRCFNAFKITSGQVWKPFLPHPSPKVCIGSPRRFPFFFFHHLGQLASDKISTLKYLWIIHIMGYGLLILSYIFKKFGELLRNL